MMARATSIIMQNLVEIELRKSACYESLRGWSVMFFTCRICLSCRYCFTNRPIFAFFAPQWWHVAPIKVKFGKSRPYSSALPYQISPWSVQECGFTAPKTLKIWNFPTIIAPKGRVPCMILTKFKCFMRVLSLHKSAKYLAALSR